MANVPLIKIFLSSPGDVNQERKIVLDAIDMLPHLPMFRGKLAIQVVAWDKPGAGTVMRATLTPQEAINKGLPKPSDCDIVFVLFWSRMGTPFDMNGESFQSGTHWELLDGLASDISETIIYRRTEKKLFDIDDIDNQDQYRRVRDFFASEMFYDDKGVIKRGVNQYETLDEFRFNFNIALQELMLEQLEQHSGEVIETDETVNNDEHVTTIGSHDWEGSPFPGLRSFTTADASIFFGRDSEIDMLIKRIEKTRFVAVVGTSGSGKSSLVGAGLLPRLMDNAIVGSKDWILPQYNAQIKQWEGIRFTPGEVGENPFLAFAMKISMITGGIIREISQVLQETPLSIINNIEKSLLTQKDWTELLLFIDQFEELFTLVNAKYVQSFIKTLVAFTKSKLIRIVITIRADFYHKAVEYQKLAELLRDGSFPLSSPDLGALLEMIEHPANRAGLIFDKGLPQEILVDAGKSTGALPLVSYTLDELYKRGQSQNVLTFEDYYKIGGVQGAIGTRADSIYLSFDDNMKRVLSDLLLKLIEMDDLGSPVRRRVPNNDLSALDKTDSILEGLVNARLLTKSVQGNQVFVEVAHEALFKSWPFMSNLIAERQDDLYLLRQLRRAASVWADRNRSLDFIWRGERNKEAQGMLKRLKPILNEAEISFSKPESDHLIAEIMDVNTSSIRRAEIGFRLDELDDNRPGTGIKDDLPSIKWCYVSSGDVTLYHHEGDIDSPIQTSHIKSFQISKYAITFLQYSAFVNAEDGRANPEWWKDFSKPSRKLGKQNHLHNNHPADMISWYDAVSFCNWLSARSGFEVRLPTDWEWQRAAIGDGYKLFPWGDEKNLNYANVLEAGLNRTIAVGMFPKGKSIFGVEDMTGNVFEWCLNQYDNPFEVDLSNLGAKVLRGGACNNNLIRSRVPVRLKYPASYRRHNVGFRVVRITN